MLGAKNTPVQNRIYDLVVSYTIKQLNKQLQYDDLNAWNTYNRNIQHILGFKDGQGCGEGLVRKDS